MSTYLADLGIFYGCMAVGPAGKAVIVTALTSSQASDSVVLAGRKVLAVFPDMQIGDDGLTDKVDWCVNIDAPFALSFPVAISCTRSSCPCCRVTVG